MNTNIGHAVLKLYHIHISCFITLLTLVYILLFGACMNGCDCFIRVFCVYT